MEYVVDIQGFRRSSNIFIVKEIAIVPINGELLPVLYFFTAPCKWDRLTTTEQAANEWLTKNLHGIPWNSGFIPYTSRIHVVQDALKDAAKIYVKGSDKTNWLKEVICGKTVVNLDEIQCPSLKKLPKDYSMCGIHPLNCNYVCAVRQAQMLKRWIIENVSKKVEKTMCYSCQNRQTERENEYMSMYI